MSATTPATPQPLRLQLGVIKAAILIMGLGLGLAAQPSQAADPENGSTGKRWEMRKEGRGGHDGTERLEELHKQLTLNESQESLWKSAQSATEELRKDFQVERRSRHEKMQKVLESKTPDLRALAKDMDQEQEARQQKHKSVREAWLKFYDALGSEQKQKASHFLLAQLGMMGMPNGEGGPGAGHHSRQRPDGDQSGRPDVPARQ